MHIAIKSFHHS